MATFGAASAPGTLAEVTRGYLRCLSPHACTVSTRRLTPRSRSGQRLGPREERVLKRGAVLSRSDLQLGERRKLLPFLQHDHRASEKSLPHQSHIPGTCFWGPAPCEDRVNLLLSESLVSSTRGFCVRTVTKFVSAQTHGLCLHVAFSSSEATQRLLPTKMLILL